MVPGSLQFLRGADTMDRIRVLVVDDHDIVREGTRRVLELEEEIEVVLLSPATPAPNVLLSTL